MIYVAQAVEVIHVSQAAYPRAELKARLVALLRKSLEEVITYLTE